MLKLIPILSVSVLLSGCIYYHGPNYRSLDYSKPDATLSWDSFRTNEHPQRYKLHLSRLYDIRNDRKVRNTRFDDFSITLEAHNPRDGENGIPDFDPNRTYQWREDKNFKIEGHHKFDPETCTLTLENKWKDFSIRLQGRMLDAKYNRYLDYPMEFKVIETTDNQFKDAKFYGDTSEYTCAVLSSMDATTFERQPPLW